MEESVSEDAMWDLINIIQGVSINIIQGVSINIIQGVSINLAIKKYVETIQIDMNVSFEM